MFRYELFDVVTERNVGAGGLRWPEGDEADDDRGLGCNREYCDLRDLEWIDAEEVFASESELISRIETAEDPERAYEDIDEESYEEPERLMGLDIGVASLVVALSAAGCVPFSSCNAGAFGGSHREWHPVVVFCARKAAIGPLLECAERAGAGLIRDESGHLIAYANDIRKMRLFTRAVMDRREEFDALKVQCEQQLAGDTAAQADLFE
jgi:hypothetical protein